MTIRHGNILSRLPKVKGSEIVQSLIKSRKLKLERIISAGQVTPEGKWLRQKRNEWVILLQGKASLRFPGRKRGLRLKPGDYVLIPKSLRHRVEWTDPRQRSVWLALHY